MDKFLLPNWNLDQIKAWALTCEPELVRRFADPCEYSATKMGVWVAAVALDKANQGRDIQGELWATGRQIREEPEPPVYLYPMECLMAGRTPIDDFHYPMECLMAGRTPIIDDLHEPPRPDPFPIVEDLEELFKAGELTLRGKLLGELVVRTFSSDDLQGIKIAEGGSPPRLRVWLSEKAWLNGQGYIEDACVARDEVLRIFKPPRAVWPPSPVMRMGHW